MSESSHALVLSTTHMSEEMFKQVCIRLNLQGLADNRKTLFV